MHSGLVHGGGTLFAFAAFETTAFATSTPEFIPTPSTPNLRMIGEALKAPDANEWRAAMDMEIENLRCLNIFRPVPHPLGTNVITPKWVYHRKFEHGVLVRYKACLVACGFSQVSRINYNKVHLYVPVM